VLPCWLCLPVGLIWRRSAPATEANPTKRRLVAVTLTNGQPEAVRCSGADAPSVCSSDEHSESFPQHHVVEVSRLAQCGSRILGHMDGVVTV